MNTLKFTAIYIVIITVITLLWQWYELASFGKVTADPFDTVITFILAISLTVNIFQCIVFNQYTHRK